MLERVQIFTATVPERRHLLDGLRASIKAQTYGNVEHIVYSSEYVGDHGTRGFLEAFKKTSAGLVMCLADDEWLEPSCVEDLVWALNAERADFAIHWRQFPGSLQQPGEPEALPTNMTTGLFKRWLWENVANICGNHKKRYSQPGADGQLGYDWVLAGAKCVSVPKVLSHVKCWPGSGELADGGQWDETYACDARIPLNGLLVVS